MVSHFRTEKNSSRNNNRTGLLYAVCCYLAICYFHNRHSRPNTFSKGTPAFIVLAYIVFFFFNSYCYCMQVRHLCIHMVSASSHTDMNYNHAVSRCYWINSTLSYIALSNRNVMSLHSNQKLTVEIGQGSMIGKALHQRYNNRKTSTIEMNYKKKRLLTCTRRS